MTDKTSKFQRWLENIWYNNGSGKELLLPLTGLYCLINQGQRWFQTRNLPSLSCPVIVVGNITVGGTGKTPLTIYLVKLLQSMGYKPAIITRGYGGRAVYWPQSVVASSDPYMVGDEAVLMAISTGVPVYAGANRLASIKDCLDKHDCDVIISDDGMQHYKMPRDIQIAVIDGERKLGNGLCLPAGPLREPKKRLAHCDFIIKNGGGWDKAKSQWIEMIMAGTELMNLKQEKIKPLKSFQAQTVNAVTGIGNPQRFYTTLENAGLKLIKHSFPDHYQFQQVDLEFDNTFPILMTEKDAVKCHSFASDKCWYLPVQARLDKHFDKQFIDLFKALKSA